MDKALSLLKNRFGYSEFRLQQAGSIQSILDKRDTFVLMPTGGGKSLCYQIPSLLFSGVTIVISPLIALMKDQVDALRLNGIAASFLNSTQTLKEQEEIMQLVRENKIALLYLAPERIMNHNMQFLQFLKSVNVSLFAIDEAHCISQWGHDFRPEYLQLAMVKEHFPQVPIIALTASADRTTQKDIVDRLLLTNPNIFVSSFNRQNIHYFVEPKRNSYERLLQYLTLHKEDSGIIYTLSRHGVENLAEDLQKAGFLVKPYHAGLEKLTRDANQDLFIQDKIKIIVATVAFGMGIDKSNVRFVIHMDLPKNIESYYQETGRAGRDGLKSEAVLFYSRGDVMKLKRFVEIDGNTQQTEIMIKKLGKMAKFCETRTCRRKFLLEYFGEPFLDSCATCDVCLTKYKKIDGTIIAQKILSAVFRLQERYGISFLIDFLRGAKSKKIQNWHTEIKTYGVGQDMIKEDWRRYIYDLIEMGYLQQTEGQYPVLQLTKNSRAVLKGEETVWLVESVSREEVKQEDLLYEKELFGILKSIRLDLARKEHVPAYIIFSDATLLELATYLPQGLLELRQISGFGDIKIKRFGQIFLDAVVSYCQEYKLSTRMKQKHPKRQRKAYLRY